MIFDLYNLKSDNFNKEIVIVWRKKFVPVKSLERARILKILNLRSFSVKITRIFKNHNLHVHSLAKIKIMKITNEDCIVNNLFIYKRKYMYKEKLCWIFFRSQKVFTARNHNFMQQAHSLKKLHALWHTDKCVCEPIF